MTLKNLIQYLDDISTISSRQNFDIRKLYGDGGNPSISPPKPLRS